MEYESQPTSDVIMQLGMAFMGSKALLHVIARGIFPELASRGRTGG
jgi:hypothetical protein